MAGDTVIAVYETPSALELVLEELGESGLDLSRVSLAARPFEEDEYPAAFYADRARQRASWSSESEWTWPRRLLLSGRLFWLPGLGPILATDPIAAIIVSELEGTGVMGDLSAFGWALVRLGVSVKRAFECESLIRYGYLLIIFHGSLDEVERARAILETAEAVPIDPLSD